MDKFALGDRVIAIVDHPRKNKDLMAGDTGTVRSIERDYDGQIRGIGVEWDLEIAAGHNLGGAIEEYGHGWWVRPTEIQIVDAENKSVKPILFDDLVNSLFE